MPRDRDSGKGKAWRAGGKRQVPGTPGMPGGALKSKGKHSEPEVHLLEEKAWQASSGHKPSERRTGGEKLAVERQAGPGITPAATGWAGV